MPRKFLLVVLSSALMLDPRRPNPKIIDTS